MLAAFAAGAAGFTSKSSSSQVMLDAVRLVLDGGKYLPPQLLEDEYLPDAGRIAAALHRAMED